MSTKNTAEQAAPERVQKIIAQAGIASRREAETLIETGMVSINGKTAKLGDKAQLGVDAIKVNGKLIQNSETKVYYLFFKPRNVIAMVNEDEEGRQTIKDYLKGIRERVFTVGRMDYTGEGAILLTNDGAIAQKLNKSNDLIRRYHVKVDRHPTVDDLARLARGGRIEKVSMIPHHIRVVQEYNRNALIEVSFQGAGVTEIRKFFENKGFFPEKVTRVGIGHIKADKMKPGELKKIDATSVEALLTQPELAQRVINTIEKKSEGKKLSSDEATDKPMKKPFGKKREFAAFERAERANGPDSAGKLPSRRPPRGRPKPAERMARAEGRSYERAPRAQTFGRDDGMISTPRFKREGGGDRPMRPAYGRGAPREDRPAFGNRPPRSDRPSFGRGAPRGDRPAFGDRPPRGDRPSFARGDRPMRSDGPRNDRANFGDRGFSRGAPRSDRPSFGRGGPRGRPMGRTNGGFKPKFK